MNNTRGTLDNSNFMQRRHSIHALVTRVLKTILNAELGYMPLSKNFIILHLATFYHWCHLHITSLKTSRPLVNISNNKGHAFSNLNLFNSFNVS